MHDESGRELQDWFRRSTEALPEQPFSLGVLARVWRSELRLRLLRYAAWLVALCSAYLLLPKLGPLVDGLATAPLGILAVGAEQWPLVLIALVVLVHQLLVRSARR